MIWWTTPVSWKRITYRTECWDNKVTKGDHVEDLPLTVHNLCTQKIQYRLKTCCWWARPTAKPSIFSNTAVRTSQFITIFTKSHKFSVSWTPDIQRIHSYSTSPTHSNIIAPHIPRYSFSTFSDQPIVRVSFPHTCCMSCPTGLHLLALTLSLFKWQFLMSW